MGDVTAIWNQALEALAIARDIDDPALLTRVLTACACVTAHDAELWHRRISTRRSALPAQLGDSWRLSQILGRQAYGALWSGDLIAVARSQGRA